MSRSTTGGFSLIELAVVMLVAGLVIAIGAISFGSYMDGLAVSGATEGIASRLALARERAMGTGATQTMRFETGFQGTDYRIEVDGVVTTGWTLPRRISYAWLTGTINSVTVTPDGRCSTSGLVILQDPRGRMDTLSVLSSGLILTK